MCVQLFGCSTTCVFAAFPRSHQEPNHPPGRAPTGELFLHSQDPEALGVAALHHYDLTSEAGDSLDGPPKPDERAQVDGGMLPVEELGPAQVSSLARAGQLGGGGWGTVCVAYVCGGELDGAPKVVQNSAVEAVALGYRLEQAAVHQEIGAGPNVPDFLERGRGKRQDIAQRAGYILHEILESRR